MTFTHALSTNNYGPAKFIVSSSAANGTHTTIGAAITAASSGDTIFIRDGTYTENLTLKAGVNLTAFGSDSSLNQTGKVIISGNSTMTTAGSVTISGIQLQTNSAALLSVTGSAASIVNLQNCNLNCSNNSGITYSSSSSSSAINIFSCTGDLGTTGINFFTSTGAGSILIYNTRITNTGASTTASSTSTGSVNVRHSTLNFALSTSSVGSFGIEESVIDCTAINTTCITLAGTGISSANLVLFGAGTASAISAGVGTAMAMNICSVSSSNTNTITGAGTVIYSLLSYSGTTSHINTTTQTINAASAFQSVVTQVFTSNGTYTPTTGMKYCIIECVGGGGGGGGCATTTNQGSAGAGGGAGGYAKKTVSAITIGASQTVTVGAAGTAGTAGNNAGGTGGTTSVGSTIVQATGGVGGAGGAAQSVTPTASVGGAGGVGSLGDVNCNGAPGGNGLACYSTSVFAFGCSGIGGSSLYGGGGKAVAGTNGAGAAGNAASLYGSGGSGAISLNDANNRAGGAGTAGIVIITEYI